MEGKIDGYLAEYGGYIEEIRRRLVRVVIVFAVTFFVGLFSTNLFIRFFLTFLDIDNVTIVATTPFQLLELAMSVGFFTATLIAVPFGIQQAYTFLSGGLLPRERRVFFVLIPASVLLFITGFIYGFAVMYFAIQVIAQVNVSFGVANLWNVTQFISQILLTSALLGFIFQFPILLALLIRLGLLQVQTLRSYRRFAIAGILIFVALLPPTDGLSFVIMSLPLVGIYELTILFNSARKRTDHLEA